METFNYPKIEQLEHYQLSHLNVRIFILASGTQAVTIIGHSYTVFMKPAKMFVLVQEKVTWDEARIQCQARHGDLAVSVGCTMNDYVYSYNWVHHA